MSPTDARKNRASSAPRMTPSWSSGDRFASAFTLPDCIADWISVTCGSRAGSMPLISTGWVSAADDSIRPLPTTAGAAPMTPGTISGLISSSRSAP